MMIAYANSKIQDCYFLLSYRQYPFTSREAEFVVQVSRWGEKNEVIVFCFCVLQAKVTLKNPLIRRKIDEAYSLVKSKF